MASSSRKYLVAAVLAVAASFPLTSFGADAQSLYQQAISVQSGTGALDLKLAQDLLEKASAAGNPLAMQRLGDMYHDGDGGVPKDFAKAMEWYQKEAALDDKRPGTGALGMVAISDMYEHGSGVTQDHDKAAEWFNKALKSAQIGTAKGENSAMIALAHCLAFGHGDVKPDTVNAWQWVLKSASNPNPWAYELMASMTGQGIGVKKDDSQALNYSLQAAQMGISKDMLQVSLCFANGIGVKKDEKMAMEWVRKAVDRGNGRAMALLGKFYHEGIGVKRDDATARDWYQKGVEMGDDSALGYMGDLYISPGVANRDSLTAQTWFEKGAKAGDVASMYQLAWILIYDDKVPHDVTRAVDLLSQASNLGSGDAMAMMGELYRADPTGKRILLGTDADALVWFKKSAATGSPMGMRDLGELICQQADGKNPYDDADDDKVMMAQGYSWLQKAAGAGDVEAVVDIGDAYYNGKGVAESPSAAIIWYTKAGEAGNVEAMRKLGLIFKDNRVLTDYDAAYKWLKRAADRNDGAAISAIGDMYDKGMIKEESGNPKTRAAQQYFRAIELDDGGGYRGIGQYLQEGTIWPVNLPQAAAYYKQAADRGDIRAMESLGRMFELGQGVQKDSKKAMELFTRAKEMGSLSAWNWVFSHTDYKAASAVGGERLSGPPEMPLAGTLPAPEPTSTTQSFGTPGLTGVQLPTTGGGVIGPTNTGNPGGGRGNPGGGRGGPGGGPGGAGNPGGARGGGRGG